MATGTTCMERAPAFTAQPEPAGAPADPARNAAWRCLAASVGSGLLLWTCYHPLAWGPVLGWIALAPLLVLVRLQAGPRWIYFCAWLGGMALFVPALHWMPVADNLMYLAWPMLACYCSLYFVGAIWLLRRLDRWQLPLVATVPLVWAALEYGRCWVMTGFSWYLLAHTQHQALAMIQITDLGGVFLVSALVALVNAFLFECGCRFMPMRSLFNLSEMPTRNLFAQGALVALLVGGTYGYGVHRLGQDQFQSGPTVCLLQTNLDQRLRDNVGRDKGAAGESVAKHCSALCYAAAFQQGQSQPDLLIWPETSYPFAWYEVSPKIPLENVPPEWGEAERYMRANLNDLAGRFTHIPHLLGMNTRYLDETGKPRQYNSAILVNAQGDVDGRFDKMHRVPFGEYVPLKDWLPFMKWFTPYDFDYGVQSGEKFTRFPLAGKYEFGVLICYEDTDPFLAREYVRPSEDGRAVDFLVNISNDGWFNGTAEHEEHLAVSRFRAIECRRAIVRAVNMGVSAVIDGNGRVLKPMPYMGTAMPVWAVPSGERAVDLPASEWHQYKKLAGILKAAVPIDGRFSFYASTGDWLPIGSWLLLFTACGVALVRRRGLA